MKKSQGLRWKDVAPRRQLGESGRRGLPLVVFVAGGEGRTTGFGDEVGRGDIMEEGDGEVSAMGRK